MSKYSAYIAFALGMATYAVMGMLAFVLAYHVAYVITRGILIKLGWAG